MTKDHKILDSIEGYNFHFDKSTFSGAEFTGEEKIEYLKKRGYNIKQVTYIESTPETDEFNAGTYTRKYLIALKPGEEIKRVGDFYSQDYNLVFKNEMKERMKEMLFL